MNPPRTCPSCRARIARCPHCREQIPPWVSRKADLRERVVRTARRLYVASPAPARGEHNVSERFRECLADAETIERIVYAYLNPGECPE